MDTLQEIYILNQNRAHKFYHVKSHFEIHIR